MPESSVRDLLSYCGGAVERVHVDLAKILILSEGRKMEDVG